jgi:hypothetical protein
MKKFYKRVFIGTKGYRAMLKDEKDFWNILGKCYRESIRIMRYELNEDTTNQPLLDKLMYMMMVQSHSMKTVNNYLKEKYFHDKDVGIIDLINGNSSNDSIVQTFYNDADGLKLWNNFM